MSTQEGHYPPWGPAKDTRVYSAESIAFDDAIRANDVAKVRQLISNGAPLDERIPHGHRPITLAAELGHIEILNELIAAGADLDARTGAGNAALHCAYDIKTLDVLLNAGVNVNTRASKSESTLLCAASGGGALSLVKALIDRGADVNLPNNHGSTPLMAAAINLNVRIVHILVAAGAKLDPQDDNGSTALMLAVRGAGKKRLQMAEAFIGAGANPNIVRRDGMTALRYACWEGDSSILAALLRSGAHVNYVTELGETALTTLVHDAPKDRYAMAKLLLEAGANPNVRIFEKHPDPARRGKTPRDLAVGRRDKRMIAVLDEYTGR